RCCERLRVNRHAATHLLDSLGHDSLAGTQSLLDDPVRACPLANLNRTDLNFVIVANDSHLIVTLQFTNGFLRNQERTFACRCDRSNPAVLAGTKDISGVREQALYAQCARFYIHLAVSERNMAWRGINRSVSQNQLQG